MERRKAQCTFIYSFNPCRNCFQMGNCGRLGLSLVRNVTVRTAPPAPESGEGAAAPAAHPPSQGFSSSNLSWRHATTTLDAWMLDAFGLLLFLLCPTQSTLHLSGKAKRYLPTSPSNHLFRRATAAYTEAVITHAISITRKGRSIDLDTFAWCCINASMLQKFYLSCLSDNFVFDQWS